MDNERLDLLGLIPCPLKVSLEKEMNQCIKNMNEYYGIQLKYKIVSNAVAQADVFKGIASCKEIKKIPNIMIAPGFSRFFYKDFVTSFRKKGYFASVFYGNTSSVYKNLAIEDPDQYYDIIAFNPLIFLVDKTNHSDISTPKRWGDLLEGDYKKMIAYRGHNDREFCEGVLLNIYNEFGRDGIKKLGETVKCRLHPAQMVKYAGSKMQEAPAISVIPYSFACMVRPNKNVEIVWPEDGAIVNPLVMLVKRNCKPGVKELAMEIAGEGIGSIFSKGGFYSIHQDTESRKNRGNYKWLGWDFIKNNNLHKLLMELNQIMFETIHSMDDTAVVMEGECDCSCN